MPRYNEEDDLPSASNKSQISALTKNVGNEFAYLQKLKAAKAKAKPVVGRQGASSPAARAKTTPAKSPDQARARNAAQTKIAPAKSPDQARARNASRGIDARYTANAAKPQTVKRPRFGGFSILADTLTKPTAKPQTGKKPRFGGFSILADTLTSKKGK